MCWSSPASTLSTSSMCLQPVILQTGLPALGFVQRVVHPGKSHPGKPTLQTVKETRMNDTELLVTTIALLTAILSLIAAWLNLREAQIEARNNRKKLRQ